MTPDDLRTLVDRIDALDGGDPDYSHGALDALLLMALPVEVQQATARLRQRCRWWATA